MREGFTLLVVWVVIAVLLVTAGCGSRDSDFVGQTAAIGGSSSHFSPKAAKARDEDPLHPVVLIQTSVGSITVQLDTEKTPLTVDNFLSYVEAGRYDQTVFHQVLKDYVILGGSYTPKLEEKMAFAPIRNEADMAPKNLRGTIAMARRPDAIDSATSQFFFNVSDNPALDHKSRTAEGYGYCVFGRVTAGMNVVDKISRVEVKDLPGFERMPTETVLIESVRRIR